MADAIVRCNVDGAWQPIAPVWSLGIESDEHGPDTASFVCKRELAKWSEAEILIAGLVIADGWVEDCRELEDSEGLFVITVWCWQRHLDDEAYTRAYLMSGFEEAIDARAGPTVNYAYWARASTVLEDRSASMRIMPDMLFYSGQGAGVTWDLGEGGVGPRKVWMRRESMSLPAKSGIFIYVRAHSSRSNHHPAVTGQFLEATAGPIAVSGTGGATWLEFTFTANTFRYVTAFMYNGTGANFDGPHDMPEYYIRFDDIRIQTVGTGGGGAASAIGSGVTSDQVLPHLLTAAPRLTLGLNTVSTVDMLSLVTDGYQTPRQMLEQLDVDYWRYRVNPGRKLDRGPYPTVPLWTINRTARTAVATPQTATRVIVQYQDSVGDRTSLTASVAGALRVRTQVVVLSSTADVTQATTIANAFLADQAQRRLEGTVVVAPGQVCERPSGAPRHPSELLLAGGDRAWIDKADDDARIATVSYSHDTETATVGLTEPAESLDHELAKMGG